MIRQNIQYALLVLLISISSFSYGQIKIVILGSSTAAGIGPSEIDSSWVNRYRHHLQSINPAHQVINLAQGGFTTYNILPTGTSTPSNRPNPHTEKNITAALSENPDAIIINLPSNDAASEFSVEEQLANYNTVMENANGANVPVWVATPQGRNLNYEGRQNLKEMRDSTYAIFGEMAIDFWTYIGQSSGTLNTLYDSGDGVHLNDNGHKLLFNRVLDKDIPLYLATGLHKIEFTKLAYKFHPKPVNNYLTITLYNDINEKFNINIYNLNGKILKNYNTQFSQSFEIDMQDLESGSYIITISNNQYYWSNIIIKK